MDLDKKHHDAPRVVNIGIWSMAVVGALAFAISLGGWFYSSVESPISASTSAGSGTCPSDKQIAINNYPGTSKEYHALLSNSRDQNWRCSLVCNTSGKSPDEFIKGLTIGGKPVIIYSTGDEFKSKGSNIGKDDFDRVVVSGATKGKCEGAKTGSTNGASIDYVDIKYNDKAVEPLSKNETIKELSQAANADTSSNELPAPIDNPGSSPSGTDSTTTPGQKDGVPKIKIVKPGTLDPDAPSYTIQISGIEKYSDSTRKPGDISITAALSDTDSKSAKFRNSPICASAMTQGPDGHYNMEFTVDGIWYRANRSAKIYYYALEETDGAIPEQNKRKRSSSDSLNNPRYVHYDGSTIQIKYNEESLYGVQGSENPVLTSAQELQQQWESFASATKLNSSQMNQCGGLSSGPTQTTQEVAQQTMQQITNRNGTVTFKISGKVWWNFAGGLESKKAVICAAMWNTTDPDDPKKRSKIPSEEFQKVKANTNGTFSIDLPVAIRNLRGLSIVAFDPGGIYRPKYYYFGQTALAMKSYVINAVDLTTNNSAYDVPFNIGNQLDLQQGYGDSKRWRNEFYYATGHYCE
ncbi:MAG: hypothetical protein NTZ65_04265 [Candidatus Berkelbacteria bacterium]|nr:hypothetical protein [Candidatus Berkelbacteria bacterium]